jgi:hypothetical protein
MQVAAVARDEAKLNSLAQSEGGHDIRPYAADVSCSDDVLRVFDPTILGPIANIKETELAM